MALAPAVLSWLATGPHRHLLCSQLQPLQPSATSGMRLRPIKGSQPSRSSHSQAQQQQQQQQQQQRQQGAAEMPPQLAALVQQPQGLKSVLTQWISAQAGLQQTGVVQQAAASSKPHPAAVQPPEPAASILNGSLASFSMSDGSRAAFMLELMGVPPGRCAQISPAQIEAAAFSVEVASAIEPPQQPPSDQVRTLLSRLMQAHAACQGWLFPDPTGCWRVDAGCQRACDTCLSPGSSAELITPVCMCSCKGLAARPSMGASGP